MASTIAGMALTIGHDRDGVTVDEFERYAENHPDDRLELIDGGIYIVAAESEIHALTADRVYNGLRDWYPAPLRVMAFGSIRIDDQSLWEPDVYVYHPNPDRDPTVDKYPHGTEVVLVVEVALNTIGRDIGRKLPVYARIGIPEYWVIDPKPDGVFHRFTNPHAGNYGHVESVPLPDGYLSLDI